MNQRIRLSVLGVVAFCAVPAAHAEVFKCVDAAGKITYSEKEEAHAKCSPATGKINVVPATRAVAPSQKTGESNEGSGRSDLQRGQLAELESALAEAKKALAEQENIRLGSEQNYQRVLDRLQPFQDKVAEIEKAIAQLREEQRKAK